MAAQLVRLLRSSTIILGSILSAALLKMLYDFAIVLSYYAHRPVNPDNLVYFVVGRGLLNGKIPYADLFEMKPPGIFVLTAISFWFTNDELPLLLFQYATFAVFASIFAVFAYAHTTSFARRDRILFFLASLVIGIACAQYLAQHVESIQAEEFGALFGLLYALSIAWRGAMTWSRIVLAVIGILGAAGMKEPFIFTLFAAGLLFIDSWQDFLKKWLIPLAIAGVIGITVMAMMGWLWPYLTIDLPFILQSRIHADSAGVDLTTTPLLLRGLWIHRLVLDIFGSPYLLFGALIVGSSFLYLTTWQQSSFRTGIRYVKFAAAVYLLSIAVAVGNYFLSHFVFALPFYCALIFFVLREAESYSRTRVLLPLAITVAALSVFYVPAEKFFSNMTQSRGYNAAASAEIVSRFDAMMEACGSKNYAITGNAWPIVTYSKFSPLGPLFQATPFVPDDHELWDQTFARLEKADIILGRADTVAAMRRGAAQMEDLGFSFSLPDCAKDFLPFDDFFVLFRRSSFSYTGESTDEAARNAILDFPDTRYTTQNPNDEFIIRFLGVSPMPTSPDQPPTFFPSATISAQQLMLALEFPILLRETEFFVEWYEPGSSGVPFLTDRKIIPSGITTIPLTVVNKASWPAGEYTMKVRATQKIGGHGKRETILEANYSLR